MKKLVMLIITLGFVMILGACQPGAPAAPAAGGPAADGALEPLTITMILAYDGIEFPQPGNDAQRAIEEFTNTRLEITAFPGATLHELLPTMIAADDMPMVVGFGGSQLIRGFMIDAMISGAFWDVTDHWRNFENLSQLNPAIFDTFKMNGRNFGLPRERGLARDAVGIRYDWVRELGLELPETVYDVFDLLIAFTESDIGRFGTANNPIDRFNIWLGGPNQWKFEDGEMIRQHFTPEFQRAMGMVRELFERGAIHPEFAIHSRSQFEALWTEGDAGMYFNVNNFAQFAMAEDDADIWVKGVFSSGAGTFSLGGSGHNGVVAFCTSATPDEVTFLRIMQFFDDLGSPEMSNLLALGFEGIHYHVVDGVAVPVIEMLDDLNQMIYMPYAATKAVLWPDARTMPVERPYLQARILEVLEENAPYAVMNPVTGLISPTFNERGGDLEQMLSDAVIQYIMGVISFDEYLGVLETWRQRGGDQISQEFAQAYMERMAR